MHVSHGAHTPWGEEDTKPLVAVVETVRAVTPCLIAVAGKHQIDTDSLARLAEYHHREDALADG